MKIEAAKRIAGPFKLQAATLKEVARKMAEMSGADWDTVEPLLAKRLLQSFHPTKLKKMQEGLKKIPASNVDKFVDFLVVDGGGLRADDIYAAARKFKIPPIALFLLIDLSEFIENLAVDEF